MEQEDMDSFRREHNRHDKAHSAKEARAKSRQRLAATATANPRGIKGTKYTTTKRSTLILYLSRPGTIAQELAGPKGIYVGFHVLGGG
jgi:hypothetical protein